MALVYVCDGCEKPMARPHLELGHVYKRQYCEACAPSASAYLARLEAIRQATAFKFKHERETLAQEFAPMVKRLPDLPEAR